MEPGQALTIWTARVAAILYAVELTLMLRRQLGRARVVATVAVSIYLVHVWAAFEYFYRWSHSFAYRETARQTAELFAVDWGGGLYLNYLFTAVWLADCAWWWLRSDPRRTMPLQASIAVHAFLVFMFVNATVVVAPHPRGPWTSEGSSNRRGGVIMTPSLRLPPKPLRGWTRRPG